MSPSLLTAFACFTTCWFPDHARRLELEEMDVEEVEVATGSEGSLRSRQGQAGNYTEVSAGQHQFDAHKIVNGEEVKLEDVSALHIPGVTKKTPAPFFVALVWKCKLSSSNQVSVDQCGGTLYHRQYVVTAAHCLQNFKYKECANGTGTFNAYLNPYHNPYVSALKGNPPNFGEDDAKQGLGIPLGDLGDVDVWFQHKDWVEALEKAEGDYAAAVEDIGLIRFKQPPFQDLESKYAQRIWKMLENPMTEVDATNRKFVVKVRKPLLPDTAFTMPEGDATLPLIAYGNGDSREQCLGLDKLSCIVQKKQVAILSWQSCMLKYLPIARSHVKTMVEMGLKVLANLEQIPAEHRAGAEEEIKKVSGLNDKLATASTVEELEPIYEELAPMSAKFALFGLQPVKDGKQFCYYHKHGATINGDSGGPLLSTDNKVLGVVSWVALGDGEESIAFAVTTSFFKKAIDATIRCLEEGVSRTSAQDCNKLVAP